MDGGLLIEEFKETFDLKELPDERIDRYQTLAGLVMSVIGRIPVSGDRFELAGLRFEVVDMDGFRVDKVLVEPIHNDRTEEL